jgi:TolA-binding protein
MLKRRFALLFLTLICAASASSFVVYAQEESPEDAATRAAEERAAAESRRIQEEEAAKERANAEILRLQINSRAKEINKLETEISKYQKELNTVSAQKRTLTNTIYELDLNRKRTTANIALTKERIGDAEERIQSLTKEVGTRSEALKRMIAATAETIRSVDSTEDTSFMENFLRNGTLSAPPVCRTATPTSRRFVLKAFVREFLTRGCLVVGPFTLALHCDFALSVNVALNLNVKV